MSDILVQAEEKTALHQYAEAEELYKQYLEKTCDPEIYLKLGVVQKKQKKYYDAIESFSIACEEVPDNTKYMEKLADCLVVIHRFDDAMTMYEKAAKISGKTRYQLKVGEMHAARGDYDGALVLFNLVRAAEPNNPDVYARIATVQQMKGMELESLEASRMELEIRRALTKSSPSATTWFNYGRLQDVIKNWDEAKVGYTESLKFENSAAAHLGLGKVLSMLKEEGADDEFAKAAALDPLDFEMLVKIGDTLTVLGNYALAIHYYTQALALRNVNADTWVAIAYALYKSGSIEDAQAFYEMAKASAAVREMPWGDKMHKSEKTEELDKVL